MDGNAFTIKIEQNFTVDFIDLHGELNSITLEAGSEDELLKCILEAWNNNLLWYFKIHLREGKSFSKIRSIPWSDSILKRALSLLQLESHIESTRGSFDLYAENVLENSSHPKHRDLELLGKYFSELNALEVVKEKLILELESSGVQISKLVVEGRAKALEFTVRAANSLKNVNDKDKQHFFQMGRITTKKATKFISELPKVSGIFSCDQITGLLPNQEHEV